MAALLKPNSHAETNGKDLVQRVQQVVSQKLARLKASVSVAFCVDNMVW